MMWMSIDEILGKDINKCSMSPTPAPTIKQVLLMSCHVQWYLLMMWNTKKNIRTSDVRILLWCDLVRVLCFYILILCKLMRSLDRRMRNKNHRTCCCKTVIICSCVAILLIRFMKPNVFELHAPISKVATLGCQWSHTAALLFC